MSNASMKGREGKAVKCGKRSAEKNSNTQSSIFAGKIQIFSADINRKHRQLAWKDILDSLPASLPFFSYQFRVGGQRCLLRLLEEFYCITRKDSS